MQKPSLFETTMPTSTFPQSLPIQSASTYDNFLSAGTYYQHPQMNFQQKNGNNFNSPFVGSVYRFMCKF